MSTNVSINSSRAGRQANSTTSEDRIGKLLDLILDGLLEAGATEADEAAGGKALIELVAIQSRRRIKHPLQREADDIKGDAIEGVWKALLQMRQKCSAGGQAAGSRQRVKGYVYGIVKRQILSAVRNAGRAVSRRQAIAWQPLEIEDERGERTHHLLNEKAVHDYRAKMKRHAPTMDEIRTAVEKAALRGELIGAALYDLCREVCEDHGSPAPKMPAAPKGMPGRTRQRREQEGARRFAELFKSGEPGMS